MQVQEIVQDATFWQDLSTSIKFLKPFRDFIHQIEADRPALARVYDGLRQLDDHVRACVDEWRMGDRLQESCDTALRTWTRRLGDGNGSGSTLQPLLNPANIAAF
jgi:hypothetical protein